MFIQVCLRILNWDLDLITDQVFHFAWFNFLFRFRILLLKSEDFVVIVNAKIPAGRQITLIIEATLTINLIILRIFNCRIVGCPNLFCFVLVHLEPSAISHIKYDCRIQYRLFSNAKMWEYTVYCVRATLPNPGLSITLLKFLCDWL